MNKDILDLIKQCETTQTSWFDGRGNVTTTYFDRHKFAQLLVDECARTCLEEGEKFRGQQDITDFKLCAKVIKERFSV